MKTSRILSLILILAFIFVLASCGSENVSTSQTEPSAAEQPPTVEKFDIYYNEEMNVGETQKITFDVVLSGQWPDIIEECPFKSSDESVLVIDKDGNATALSAGTVTVTVSYQTAQKSVEITVCGFVQRPNDPYVKKPIIYLYPTEPTDVTVTYFNSDDLITTYPKYNGAWRVSAVPDGTLTDENGRQYYALFFDEARTYTVDFKTGFYVTAEDAIPFLEEKLALLGLNEREADEFIMFWLPVLEQNGQSVVYFEQTAEREAECPLDVSPTPDSVLRVIIHIKKVDAPVDMVEQTLAPFERTGFTLVEWGGTMY